MAIFPLVYADEDVSALILLLPAPRDFHKTTLLHTIQTKTLEMKRKQKTKVVL